jgi:Domain of unknown function (DUF4440)
LIGLFTNQLALIATRFTATFLVEQYPGQASLEIGSAHATQLNDEAPSATDEKQIAEILKKWEDAWNTHDMSAYASLYHDDGVWILWTGNVWKGRQSIEEGHAAVHKTIFRNSVRRENLEEQLCTKSRLQLAIFLAPKEQDVYSFRYLKLYRAPACTYPPRAYCAPLEREGL